MHIFGIVTRKPWA